MHKNKWGGVSWRMSASLLGIFLVLAACLKAHGLFVDPLAQDGIFSAPWLQVTAIELEFILGLWLLCNWLPRLAWLVSLLLFGMLSAASLYLALTGQASCGCFGQVKVNPWITFAIDTAAVATLLLFRPQANQTWSGTSDLFLVDNAKEKVEAQVLGILKSIFQTAALVAILLGILATGFLTLNNNPWYTLARLRGETLSVEPAVSLVGQGELGQTRLIPITLHNYSETSIRVIGGSVSCACMTLQDLPMTVPAGGTVTVNIEITFKGSPGRFSHSFRFFHDGPEQSTVGRFTGTVRPAQNPSARLH